MTSIFSVLTVWVLARTTNVSKGQIVLLASAATELIILRIDLGASSKSVNIGINLFDFTVESHSAAQSLLSPSTAKSGNMFGNYGTL